MKKIAKKSAASKKAASKTKEAPRAAKKAAPVDVERVERRRYTERLLVPIDAAEAEAKNKLFAAKYREQEATKAARRAAMAGYRERLVGIEQAMSELSDSVEHHTEKRDVEVIEYLIVPTNEIHVVRSDTGEIVSTRAAEADDRQEALFDEAKEPAHKGVRPTKRAKTEPIDLGDIDDPAAVLANDAGVDAPPPPKRRRGGKELPRTEEDRAIARIDAKNGKGEDNEDESGIVHDDYAGDDA